MAQTFWGITKTYCKFMLVQKHPSLHLLNQLHCLSVFTMPSPKYVPITQIQRKQTICLHHNLLQHDNSTQSVDATTIIDA